MKKLLILASFIAVVAGCNQRTGELVGVIGREKWYQPDPFGTLFIPMGSYHMGPDDEEAPMAHTTKSKMVSVQAFNGAVQQTISQNGLELPVSMNRLAVYGQSRCCAWSGDAA